MAQKVLSRNSIATGFGLLATLLLLVTYVAGAADYAREKKWAGEITPGIVVGDAVYLTTRSGVKFLAIYTEAPNAKRAVILAHGLGVHPDWGIIGALRVRLADLGYTTLSLQMPVLAADAKADGYPETFPDAAERFDAGVAFLVAKKANQKIGIASHSMGARMTNYWLITQTNPGVVAWASIGIGNGVFEDPAKLKLPVLDVYGQNDLEAVLSRAPGRRAAISDNPGSAQVVVPGADHYFNGKEAALADVLNAYFDEALK